MNGGRRFWMALVATAFSMIFVVGLTLGLAYDLALERQQALLAEVAAGHARMIRNAFAADAAPDSETAIQAFLAQGTADALGHGGEVLLVRRTLEGVRIVARLPDTGEELPGPIAMDSRLAKPSRAAVTRETGMIDGPDYRGVFVMAAVAPVPDLDLAVVAKSNRADVRAPFFRMVSVVAFVAACMVLAASLTVAAFGRSAKRDRQRLERLLAHVLDAVPDGAAVVDPADGRLIAANAAFTDLLHVSTDGTLAGIVADPALVRAILDGEIEEEQPVAFQTNGETPRLSATARRFAFGETEVVLVSVRDPSEHRRLEAAVLDAEHRYKTLFEHPTDMVAILDAEGFIDCNSVAAQAFGLASRAEAVGRHPAEFSPDSQPDGGLSEAGFRARIDAALGGTAQRFDWTFIHADRTPFVADISLAAADMREGRALIAIARDVTACARALDELRQETDSLRRDIAATAAAPAAMPPEPAVVAAPPPPDRYRHVFATSGVGIAVVGIDGRIQEANPMLHTILGYDPGELDGMPLVDLASAEDRPACERRIGALRNGSIDLFNAEHRFVRQDGTLLWVHLRVSISWDTDGTPNGIVAQIEDIDERRAAQQSLAESERRYRSLVDNNPDGVIVTRNHVVAFANASAAAIFGANDPEALIGKDVSDLIAHRDRAAIDARMKTLLETDEPSPLAEFQFLRLDGSAFAAEVTGSTIRWRGETAVQSVIRDISRRRDAEDRVLRLNHTLAHLSRLNSLGEMATGLAHEVNQPLAAIANFARGGLMQANGQDGSPDAVREAFENIEEQAMRAGDVIRRVRTFIQNRDPIRRTCDINAAIEEAVVILQAEAQGRKVAISLDLAESLPGILSDPLQIQQVVLNLGRNAVEAMDAAGSDPRKLRVRSGVGGGAAIEIAIEDTGPGIAEDLRDKIFKPFVTTKESGLGMGLPTSRTMAEALGGELLLDSTYDRGTRMVLRLPLDAPLIG